MEDTITVEVVGENIKIKNTNPAAGRTDEVLIPFEDFLYCFSMLSLTILPYDILKKNLIYN